MSENSNDFKKGTSNFRLVGKIKLTPNTFSIGKQSDSGFISNKMYIGVDCGGGNIVYSQLFDGYKKNEDGAITKKLFVHGSKADPNNPRRSIDDFDNKIEILWADRHSPDWKETIASLGPSCFVNIGLLKDNKGNLITYRFVSEYDAIEYCQKELTGMTEENLNSLVVEIRGTIEYRYYEGRVTYQKTITSIKRRDDVEEKDYCAEFSQTVYADKDSIGKADMERKVIPLTVKVPEYVSKYKDAEVKETVPLDVELQLDATAPIAKWLATNISKSSGYARMTIIGNFIESGAAEEFDINTLDPDTKGMLDAGVITLEDIKMTVAIGQQRTQIMSINRIRVIRGEDGKPPVGDFTASVYKAKEMEEFGENFFAIVKEMDNNQSEDTETVDPTDDGADEAPFDTGVVDGVSNTGTDDMDWMKNFS